jgi:hypothetical protein
VLETNVTEDETMVLYYDPLSKREPMECRRKGEAPQENSEFANQQKR